MEKKVYIVLKNSRRYSGIVIDVDDSKPPLTWIILTDKFGQRVTFSTEEIDVIEEEL